MIDSAVAIRMRLDWYLKIYTARALLSSCILSVCYCQQQLRALIYVRELPR